VDIFQQLAELGQLSVSFPVYLELQARCNSLYSRGRLLLTTVCKWCKTIRLAFPERDHWPNLKKKCCNYTIWVFSVYHSPFDKW
jgi:hypothetical protein